VLLCGDVHMNPGPEYPCGKCSLNVNDDDKLCVAMDVISGSMYHVISISQKISMTASYKPHRPILGIAAHVLI